MLIANIKGAAGSNGSNGAIGATGSNGSNGSNGATGATGANGNAILTGAGAPSNALGVDGDLYLNTTSFDLLKKAGGVW